MERDKVRARTLSLSILSLSPPPPLPPPPHVCFSLFFHTHTHARLFLSLYCPCLSSTSPVSSLLNPSCSLTLYRSISHIHTRACAGGWVLYCSVLGYAVLVEVRRAPLHAWLLRPGCRRVGAYARVGITGQPRSRGARQTAVHAWCKTTAVHACWCASAASNRATGCEDIRLGLQGGQRRCEGPPAPRRSIGAVLG